MQSSTQRRMVPKAVLGIVVRELVNFSPVSFSRDLVVWSNADARGITGEIEVDDGEWDDWEERTHGSIDTAENREEYPKGFAWDCCGEKLDSKKLGCVEGPHQEVVQRRIIRRDRASYSYY